MAKELGIIPKKLGGLANYKQETWKNPLPVFIEDCYENQSAELLPNGSKGLACN